jgi:hypothetical protein
MAIQPACSDCGARDTALYSTGHGPQRCYQCAYGDAPATPRGPQTRQEWQEDNYDYLIEQRAERRREKEY